MSGIRRPRVDPLLSLVVLLGFAWAAWFALRCRQYFIQPDELEYVRQSLHIGSHLFPLLPGDREFASYSQLQPLLMAPAWSLFGANTAHQVQHVVNALVMASTAIPVYLLSVRVLRERPVALLVALCSVAVPWMAASTTMMTEVASYPAFAWGVLGVHRAIARPSGRATLWAIAGIALAFFARPQFAGLAIVLVAGLVVQEARIVADPLTAVRPRGQRLAAALGRHRRLVGVVVVLALVALATGATGRLFGGYDVTTQGSLLSSGALSSGREVLAYIVVGIGIVPFALTFAWVAGELASPEDAERHAFALVALLTGLVLTLAVGSFVGRFTPQGINSRYLFYLAPLMLLASAALLRARRPRTLALVAGGLVTTWLIYGAKLLQDGPSLVSPDSVFHAVLYGHLGQAENHLGVGPYPPPHALALIALVLVLLLAAARRLRVARHANLLAALFVFAFCVADTGYAYHRLAQTQQGVSQAFLDGRDWIDRALPAGAKAPVLVSSLGQPAAAPAVWWDVSFWNKKVSETLVLPGPIDFQQPFPIIVSADSVRAQLTNFDPNGTPHPLTDLHYLVRAANDRAFGFRRAAVLEEQGGVQLLRLGGRPDLAWIFHGTDDTGRLQVTVPAPLRIFNPTPGRAREVSARVTLTTSATATRGYAFTVSGADNMHGTQPLLRKGATRTITLRARAGGGARDGYADVTLQTIGRVVAANPQAGLQVTAITTSP